MGGSGNEHIDNGHEKCENEETDGTKAEVETKEDEMAMIKLMKVRLREV